MTRSLVDESVTKNIREWLKKRGFESLNVSDTTLKAQKTKKSRNIRQKNSMTIITLDTDIAQIYHNSPKGILSVIVIKVNNSTPAAILETLTRAHEKIDLKKTQNQLIIITQRKIRIIN